MIFYWDRLDHRSPAGKQAQGFQTRLGLFSFNHQRVVIIFCQCLLKTLKHDERFISSGRVAQGMVEWYSSVLWFRSIVAALGTNFSSSSEYGIKYTFTDTSGPRVASFRYQLGHWHRTDAFLASHWLWLENWSYICTNFLLRNSSFISPLQTPETGYNHWLDCKEPVLESGQSAVVKQPINLHVQPLAVLDFPNKQQEISLDDSIPSFISTTKQQRKINQPTRQYTIHQISSVHPFLLSCPAVLGLQRASVPFSC